MKKRFNKRTWILILIGLLALVMANIAVPILKSRITRQHPLTDYDLEVVTTADWVFHQTPQGSHGNHEVIASIANPPNEERGITLYHNNSDFVRTEDVAAWRRDELEQLQGFWLIREYEKQTQHFRGTMTEYEYTIPTLRGDALQHCQDWNIIHAGEGYALQMCSSDKDWPKAQPIFERILNDLAPLR